MSDKTSDKTNENDIFQCKSHLILCTRQMLQLFSISETLRETPLHQCCSKEENELIQKAVGWRKSSALHFPRAIVLGPEQIEAINSESRVVLLMGEAGTGKTTVLLATLFKYIGKHVSEKDRKKVVFSIPYHKKTFKNDILFFIKQFCVREWVEIVLGFDEERVCRNTGSTVYLFDEIYDTNFLSRILARGKIYAVVIPGEKMTFDLKCFHLPRSDLELIYFRKIYRTPAEISRCCVKLKRLLDGEKYERKNLVKANSLDYNSIHQNIPWELSFSNSVPLRGGNAIEIKTYRSLQMEDLKSSIGKSDLIVSLNFEKKKIEEMDVLFDKNTVFHENTKDAKQNDKTSVQRSGDVDAEIIVLIVGKNFKKEHLTSQQSVLQYIELKHCVVHVICDYRVSQEVNHFLFNFGLRYIYEEPDEFGDSGSPSIPRSSLSDAFQSMHDRICPSKLIEKKTQVITFCQTVKVVEIISSIFQESAVAHMNIQAEKIGLENFDHRGGQKSSRESPRKAVKNEIVLIFELPVVFDGFFSPTSCELVGQVNSLTLIIQNSLNDGRWRLPSVEEMKKKDFGRLDRFTDKML